jgi:branched-subunit amino acid aminotransferase/4-amino-4-deoxychorismate lyase
MSRAMHKFVSFNCQNFLQESAFLSALSNAALYGKGIFTTVAVYNSKPFLWEKHWRRLMENARKIRLDLSHISEQIVKNSLFKITGANNFRNGRARITIFDGSASSVWQNNPVAKTNLLIQTADFRRIKRIYKLTVSPFRVNSGSPLANVKSCNYLENILAFENAKAKSFDEAIRLNERGEVVSACLANLFWKRKNAIYTPSLETGCLNGTTREFITENFVVKEKKAKLNELYEADEIFLTSAGVGIVKVSDLNLTIEK